MTLNIGNEMTATIGIEKGGQLASKLNCNLRQKLETNHVSIHP